MEHTRGQITCEDSDQQSTDSGTFNDDLLTEILLRLPSISILRFKSVSKHWRWLLNHRRFTLRYDSLSKSPGLFAYNEYVPFDVENQTTLPFRSLDFYPDRYGIKIVQSCNGLLLCCSGRCCYRKYYVFNPTSKQFAVIPEVPDTGNLFQNQIFSSIRFMGLAFHQTGCVHYKVVCIRTIGPDGKLSQILIYSSDTRKWKISIESFSAAYPTFEKGVYWNGALHWAPSYRSHLYFKLEGEQLQTLHLPVEMASSRTLTMYFGESRGHLHLIVTDCHEHSRLHLNVYEMLSDHSGWFVKYQVGLDELLVAFPEMIDSQGGCFNVIDVVRGEKEEDTFMVLVMPEKIIKYNVHDKSFKKLSNVASYLDDEFSNFHRYTEALTSF